MTDFSVPKGILDSKISLASATEIESFYIPDDGHKRGYVTEFEAPADKGKTLGIVAWGYDLCTEHGYSFENVHANFHLNPAYFPGSHSYRNDGIRELVSRVIRDELTNMIIMVTEMDSVYPSRSFMDKEQTQELLKLNQFTKAGNHLLFDRHMGSAIDKIVRDCTQLSIEPELNYDNDELTLWIIDGVSNLPIDILLVRENASEVYDMYNRWELIG